MILLLAGTCATGHIILCLSLLSTAVVVCAFLVFVCKADEEAPTESEEA
jgi:hypothetical protein